MTKRSMPNQEVPDGLVTSIGYWLARTGIVTPELIQNDRLGPYHHRVIADIVERYATMFQKGDGLWNPLTIPKKEQFVVLNGEVMPPREIMAKSIALLGLPPGCHKALMRENLDTVGKLLAVGPHFLKEDACGISTTYVNEIDRIIHGCGIVFHSHREGDGYVMVGGTRRPIRIRTELSGVFPFSRIALEHDHTVFVDCATLSGISNVQSVHAFDNKALASIVRSSLRWQVTRSDATLELAVKRFVEQLRLMADSAA